MLDGRTNMQTATEGTATVRGAPRLGSVALAAACTGPQESSSNGMWAAGVHFSRERQTEYMTMQERQAECDSGDETQCRWRVCTRTACAQGRLCGQPRRHARQASPEGGSRQAQGQARGQVWGLLELSMAWRTQRLGLCSQHVEDMIACHPPPPVPVVVSAHLLLLLLLLRGRKHTAGGDQHM